MDRLCVSRSDKAFDYVLGMDPGLEGIGGLRKAESHCKICLSFFETGVCLRERGTFADSVPNRPGDCQEPRTGRDGWQ